jgi:predicted HTH transcriptional regulator
MEASELLDLIERGESSNVQFKERLPHQDSLAQEMVAFSNSEGGLIIIGVNDKTGSLNGLTFEEIQKTNQQLVNVASQHVFPSIIISTKTVKVNNHNLIVVEIKEGLDKPYKDRLGSIYMKNGSDKRRVISNNEIARLLRSSKALYADETPIQGTSIGDTDINYYKKFIQRKYKKEFEDLHLELQQSLENLNLMKDGNLTLAGLLCFAKNRHTYRPQFTVQCVSVNSTTLIGNNFTDNETSIEGNLEEVFNKSISFIDRNLRKIPSGKSFNSPAVWEIPYEVFEELLVNALVHRDYFISATIKIFVFTDRIEIVNPGKLPNSLTVENIKSGVSVVRNPILHTMAQHILPYKGLGTGVMRAVSAYPEIEFENDKETEKFVVRIMKKYI